MKRHIDAYDWVIHGVVDGGNGDFVPGMADYHTHGLDKYGSLELQMVLDFKDYAFLLNKIGELIKDGNITIYDGVEIEGLFDDEAKVRINQTTDCNGEYIWRIIIPDGEFKYPENSREYPYYMQMMPPYKRQYCKECFQYEKCMKKGYYECDRKDSWGRMKT